MSESRNLTVVLVNMPVPEIEDDRRQPPGGLVSLATYLASHKYHVTLRDLSGSRLSIKDLCNQLPEAEVYGFSTYTVTFHDCLALVAALRQRQPRAHFIAGGPHASAVPAEVAPYFDYVVCGEGEYTLLDILRRIGQDQTEWTHKIICSSPIQNLDELPFPNFYSFGDITGYSRRLKGNPVISLDSSRGCNYLCRFCNSRVVERGKWRMRSAESVVAEVRWHHTKGWKAVRFNDDNFLADRQRVLQICDLLRPLDIEFRIFGRAQSLDSEVCDALAKAGCRHIGIGVESMSSYMLARMGKAASVSCIREGVKAAHQAGITVRGFFICGFPGETDQTIAESTEALGSLALDEAVVYPCIPYPGTDLFTSPEKYGITWIDPDYSKFIQIGINRSAGFVMRTNTFGPDEVRVWHAQYMQSFENLGIAWSAEKEFAI
jgi:anaerobic magnesium-protoporphyrin IX monomethyl ester cyclase